MRWDLEGSKSPGIRRTGFGWKFWDADPPERWVTLGGIVAIPAWCPPRGQIPLQLFPSPLPTSL
jgi:hypothetical protein